MASRLQSPEAEQWRRAFGARIRQLRVKRGYSQEGLAHAAGVHRTYVGAVERGEQNVSLVLIHVFAETLQVPVARLFDDES